MFTFKPPERGNSIHPSISSEMVETFERNLFKTIAMEQLLCNKCSKIGPMKSCGVGGASGLLRVRSLQLLCQQCQSKTILKQVIETQETREEVSSTIQEAIQSWRNKQAEIQTAAEKLKTLKKAKEQNKSGQTQMAQFVNQMTNKKRKTSEIELLSDDEEPIVRSSKMAQGKGKALAEPPNDGLVNFRFEEMAQARRNAEPRKNGDSDGAEMAQWGDSPDENEEARLIRMLREENQKLKQENAELKEKYEAVLGKFKSVEDRLSKIENGSTHANAPTERAEPTEATNTKPNYAEILKRNPINTGKRMSRLAWKAIKKPVEPMKFGKLRFAINDSRYLKHKPGDVPAWKKIRTICKKLAIDRHVSMVSKIGNRIIEIYFPETKRAEIEEKLDAYNLRIIQSPIEECPDVGTSPAVAKEAMVRRISQLYTIAWTRNLKETVLEGLSNEAQDLIKTACIARAQAQGNATNLPRDLVGEDMVDMESMESVPSSL